MGHRKPTPAPKTRPLVPRRSVAALAVGIGIGGAACGGRVEATGDPQQTAAATDDASAQHSSNAGATGAGNAGATGTGNAGATGAEAGAYGGGPDGGSLTLSDTPDGSSFASGTSSVPSDAGAGAQGDAGDADAALWLPPLPPPPLPPPPNPPPPPPFLPPK